MAERLLEVSDLSVAFDTREGVVRAARGVSFHVDRGEILGFVGESGSGKSVSVMSCLGLIARNGRIERGSIRFEGRELSPVGKTTRSERRRHEAMLRSLRGNEIGMIFQDPMTYMNPVLTVGTQVTEGILAHTGCSRREAWARGVHCWRWSASPVRSGGCGSTPTRSPAACASASSSPSRWPATRSC